MPNRILREAILTSGAVDKLGAHAEILFRRLMSVVDDFGRFDARPAIVRARCYPLRIDKVREADIARLLAEVQEAGLIALYDVDGKPFGVMHKTDAPRAKKSMFPAPPAGIEAVSSSASTCAHMRPYSYSSSYANTSTEKSPRKRGAPVDLPDIPESLDDPEFREAWQDWLDDRKARKKGLTHRAAKAQLAKLAPHGVKVAVSTIRKSIEHGWVGLFPPEEAVPAQDEPPAMTEAVQSALDAIGWGVADA